MDKIDYSNCMNFDSTRCPKQNFEIMKKAASDIPDYTGGEIKIMPEFDIDEVNKICNSCDNYRLKNITGSGPHS